MATSSERQSLTVLVAAFAVVMVLAAPLLAAPSVSAQDDSGESTPGETSGDEQLRQGAQVYGQFCASCHQAGGIGLGATFPPLIDNPNVDDAGYVTAVITNGLSGEVVVGDTTYDGVMPSFSTLSDEDTAAVVAYIMNDFVAPVREQAVPAGSSDGAVADGSSGFTSVLKWLVPVLAIGVGGVVFAPRIMSRNDRLHVRWLDAALKTTVIVIAAVVLIVIIPDRVVRAEFVAKQNRFYQDLIGVGAWFAGLALLLWGLWYAHRESRI